MQHPDLHFVYSRQDKLLKKGCAQQASTAGLLSLALLLHLGVHIVLSCFKS